MPNGQASGPALDILADLAPAHAGRNSTCDIRRLRAERPELAEQYDKALALGSFSDRAIAGWITDHGFAIAKHTIARHRQNECLGCRG